VPEEGTDNELPAEELLSADEPLPYVVRNPDAIAPLLLVCDHACSRFPRALGTMGLDPVARRCHLALDIGAGALTEALAQSLGVTAVLCQYSRLVIDCNRQLMDPGAYLEFGDGMVIPGNRNLRREEKRRRADAIYWPYHAAIEAQVRRLRGSGVDPVFLAIHSFTPVLNGEFRTWEMGILWDRDRVTAELLINGLRQAGYLVGDNEPYSGKAPQDFTVDDHAERPGLLHAGIEIRQDLIDNDDGVERIVAVMHEVLKEWPAKSKPTEISTRQSG